MGRIITLITLLIALPASAQSPLSLSEAIARAKARNPDAGSAAAAEREAADRVTQARGGHFPKVDVAESWQRGNHPVFVFSALLAQRQFTAADFALDAINHPAATDNFRTAFSIEQPLFDRTTSANVRAASIGRDMAATARRLVDHDLTAAVTDAFGRVLVAAATVRSAAAAVETARVDRELARNRRDAGRADLEEEALKNRPDVALAIQQEQLAAATVDAARAAFLPQVAAQGGWELNGSAWNSRSSSWVAGAAVRFNLFHGLADKARLAEAREQATRRALERDKAETMARLDVQIAMARLTDAAMLLRSADAVQQADVQQITARVNVLTATATLQRAIGRP